MFPILLNQNSSDILFGNNLPITNPRNFVVALNINDNSDGSKAVALTEILIPAKSELRGRNICINGITIIEEIYVPFQDKKKLWDFQFQNIEPTPSSLQKPSIELAPSAGEQYYVVIPKDPTRGVITRAGIVSSFSNVCTSAYPQQISINELQSNYGLNGQAQTLNDTSSDSSFLAQTSAMRSAFFYPFDGYELQLDVWLNSQIGSFGPTVIGEIHSSDWVVSPNTDDGLEISYSRPYAIQFLTCILLLSLFLIIVFSALIGDMPTYFGLIIGLLLGMNSLRPIMKLPDGTGTSMIDDFFLGFYILMGLTLFLKLIVFPLWNIGVPSKTEKYSN